MGNYKVVSITDREGNPRTDGRYPDRVGRICAKPNVRIGEQMVIQWISNADGTPYVGELTTSMAISYIEIKGKITVTTRHSVYTFEKLCENQKLLITSAGSTRARKKNGEKSLDL